MAALLLACSLGAQADARLAEETSHLINTIRQKLDACGEEGSLGTLQLQATAQPASLTARVAIRPALAFSTRLAAVAARHARSMAEQQFFDHTDPQGKTVGHRATEAGYRWRVVGENLAAGHETIGDAVRGWLLSTGHCQNLIDPRFNEFGIARVSASSLSDPYGSYWVLVLGRSTGNDVASR
jgi:uncharacterized protein YkwD